MKVEPKYKTIFYKVVILGRSFVKVVNFRGPNAPPKVMGECSTSGDS